MMDLPMWVLGVLVLLGFAGLVIFFITLYLVIKSATKTTCGGRR